MMVSGVVIKTSGGSSVILRLTDCGVSPCLICMVNPSFSAYLIILLNTSRLSARSGVTYSAFIFPGFFDLAILAKIGTTAVSVLPDPVGATTSESIF